MGTTFLFPCSADILSAPEDKNVVCPHFPFSMSIYRPLWLPSQNGLSALCLQPHSHTFVVSLISSFTGEKPLSLCAPSQNGWFFDLPQAHHQ